MKHSTDLFADDVTPLYRLTGYGAHNGPGHDVLFNWLTKVVSRPGDRTGELLLLHDFPLSSQRWITTILTKALGAGQVQHHVINRDNTPRAHLSYPSHLRISAGVGRSPRQGVVEWLLDDRNVNGLVMIATPTSSFHDGAFRVLKFEGFALNEHDTRWFQAGGVGKSIDHLRAIDRRKSYRPRPSRGRRGG